MVIPSSLGYRVCERGKAALNSPVVFADSTKEETARIKTVRMREAEQKGGANSCPREAAP